MIAIQDWGLIDYHKAWDEQKKLVQAVQNGEQPSTLVLCEHNTVITIGRNGTAENIVCHPELLKTSGVEVVEIDRGGDVTLHNPGQLVGYPIFNLKEFKQDLHWFLREIEGAIIDVLSFFALNSERIEGLTGVWIDGRRKICAIGLHCSRWITSHGFALNVNNNLSEFSYIIPCGIRDKEITSISRELGTEIEISKVKVKLREVFFERFT